MGIFFLGQTVVTQGLHGVTGAHEGFQEADLQGRADGQGLEQVHQFLNLFLLAQITAGDVLAEDVFTVFGETLWIRFLMDAIDGGRVAAHQFRSDGFIGEEHVFLDQLMGDIVLCLFDAQDFALFIEADLGLGEIEFQRAVLEAVTADLLREMMCGVNHPLDVVICGFALQDGEHFLVGEAALRMDDGGVEAAFQHAAIIRDEELDTLGEAFDVGLERAQFIAQGLWEHRDDAVHEVGGVAALAGFFIQQGTGLHVMRDIGDVYPELPLALGDALEADGVIEIFGVIGVDGDDEVLAAVFAAGDLLRLHLIPIGAGFCQDFVREAEREIVLAQDGEHVHAFGIGRAEDFHDLAFGIRVAGFPLLEINYDFVTDVGGTADVLRFGHVDVVLHARVIGDDVEEAIAAPERADDAHAFAVEDADDLAGGDGLLLRAQALCFHIQADEDAVAIHGGAGIAVRDDDLFEIAVIGLEKAFAAAVDAEAAGDKIGFQRADEAVAFDAGDLAGLFQLLQGGLQIGLVLGGKVQIPEEFREIGRGVIFLPQQLQDSLG